LHLDQQLPLDDYIADVGANFGYYSVELATALGAAARVVAFEPFPLNYARLERHVRLNDLASRVQMLPLALSDRSGVATMDVRRSETRNTGSAQLRGEGVAIRTARLDDLWPTLGYVRLDLLKIDVEGHEVRVLEGASRVIREHRPMMLIEIDPPRLAESGSSPAALLDALRSFGYELFHARRRALVPVGSASPQALVNTFCIHPSRRALPQTTRRDGGS
jgi:FkbM family methyltransferase